MPLAFIRSSRATLKREAINDSVSPDCTMYTGPSAVCAEAGETEKTIMIIAVIVMRRLCILEFHFVPDLVVLPTIGMGFEYETGGLG